METLLRWIHLSDIHVGHGDVGYGWDQRLVMAALTADIKGVVERSAEQPIDAIFVTGDLANTGAGRRAEEYDEVGSWLAEVGAAAKVPADRIYLVPGNHDVNRGVDADPATKALVDALRSGARGLDDALASAPERALLAARQAKFLQLARRFAPPTVEGDGLFWVHRLTARSGLPVRIVGLNTALLAAGDDDQGKLRLGLNQIHEAFAKDSPDELVLVLGHHPLRDGWLADQAQIEPWMKKHAHVLLTGHVHEADADQSRSGSGAELLRVVAGSVHGDKLPPGIPAGHGYSFGAVVRDGGRAKVRVAPRKWSAKNSDFRPDGDNVPQNASFSEHALPERLVLPAPGAPVAKRTIATPAVKVVPGEPVPIFVSGSSAPRDVALRDALLKHLVNLRRLNKAKFTHAQQVEAGKDAKAWVKEQIDGARIIVLLISKDYIGDDAYYEDHLLRAMERHERGEARVIPILLRSFDISDEPFAGLRWEPRDEKPVERDPPAEDEVFTKIAYEMRVVVASMRGEPRPER